MPRTASAGALTCSFCAKSQDEVAKLVAGPGVFICDECIDLCTQIIAEETGRPAPTNQPADQPADQPTNQPADQPAGQQPAPEDVPPPIRGWDGCSDEQLLAEMARAHGAHDNVDRAVGRYVTELRARGLSWARIGEALGMTRQSAWERFSGED